MGTPPMAADFKEKQDVPFMLLVDSKKETYEALELKRGNIWDVAGPPAWLRFAKGMLQGHGAGRPQQDVYQLAGTAVVDTDGRLLFMQRAQTSADNAKVDDVLAVLPRVQN